MPVVLALELLPHLTHQLSLFKGSLFLHIQLTTKFNHLVLLNHGLIIEDLSELLFIGLQFLNIFMHFLSFLPKPLGLIS